MGVDTYIGGSLCILAAGAVAVAGSLLTRKVISQERLRSSHEVGGYMLSVVGTLFAVLLGLVVVDSMQRFQKARDITEQEANSLADVFIFAARLPEPSSSEVKKLCLDYDNLVVNQEWKDMDSGTYCPQARRMAVALMQKVLTVDPITENQRAVYPQLISEASQMWQCRRTRINMAVNGVPTVEWVTLFAGAIITVFFTYFFGLENWRLQLVMTAMISVLISLNMFLVALFGYPFSGALSLHPDGFRINQGIFDNNLSNAAY